VVHCHSTQREAAVEITFEVGATSFDFEKASVHQRAADELIIRTPGDADPWALLCRSSLSADCAGNRMSFLNRSDIAVTSQGGSTCDSATSESCCAQRSSLRGALPAQVDPGVDPWASGLGRV